MNLNSETNETAMVPMMTPSAEVKTTERKLSPREKKVERIKNKISSGKYRVSNFDLAKALILSL